jgi:aspartate aminotransferase-like enzyme
VPDVPQSAYPADSDPQFTLASGPSGATAATLAALGRPILHHLDPAFGALYQQTAELLQQAFETRTSPVILPGEAVVGLEAAAASLIGAGDVVLNLVSGMYGRGPNPASCCPAARVSWPGSSCRSGTWARPPTRSAR